MSQMKIIATMLLPFRLWLRNIAYPIYECEWCVGQEKWHGCYCSAHNAFAPGDSNGTWWEEGCRRMYDDLFGPE